MGITQTTILQLNKPFVPEARTTADQALNDNADILEAVVPPLSGAGSPVGVLLPGYVGRYYRDTGDEGEIWKSTGLLNTNWISIYQDGHIWQKAQRTTWLDISNVGISTGPDLAESNSFYVNLDNTGLGVLQGRTGAGPGIVTINNPLFAGGAIPANMSFDFKLIFRHDQGDIINLIWGSNYYFSIGFAFNELIQNNSGDNVYTLFSGIVEPDGKIGLFPAIEIGDVIF